MTDIWFTSDHHWGDANILNSTGYDGKPMRPQFLSVEEMDEYMVNQWNSVVRAGHKVYHLGDVCMDTTEGFDAFMRVANRLKGLKRLVPGNHDPIVDLVHTGIFKKIFPVWRVFGDEGFVCTHVPINRGNFPGKQQRNRRTVLNVHGHTHTRNMRDPMFFNVSVEEHDYMPVHMDEILHAVKQARSYLDGGFTHQSY